MNKFVQTIAGSAEGIKLQRAKNTATAVQLAQEALINNKRSAVQAHEARLTQLLDIGPDSNDSLRPVARDFDAAGWVANVQDVKISLAKAQDHLDVATITYNEWFAEAATK
jgi:hypothetical protein